MSERQVTIDFLVNAGGMDAGIQQALARNREFAAESRKINDELHAAGKAYAAPQDAANLQQSDARLTQAIAAQRENIEKGALRQRMAELEKAANQRWAVEQKNLTVLTSLKDIEYRTTHTALQVQLRDRQAYYAQLRAAHAGNAAILTQIDKTQLAETTRIEETFGTGGLGRQLVRFGKVGRGYRHVAMAMMMAGGPVGELAGGALGAGHVIEGLAGSGLGFTGGVATAGIAAGAIALGYAFHDNEQKVKAATDRMKEINEEGHRLAENFKSLSQAKTAGERTSALEKLLADARQRQEALNLEVTGKQKWLWSSVSKEDRRKLDDANREVGRWSALVAKGHDAAEAEQKTKEAIADAGKGGQFQDAAAHWRSVQSAILGRDVPQAQLDRLTRIAEGVEKLNQGVKVRAA